MKLSPLYTARQDLRICRRYSTQLSISQGEQKEDTAEDCGSHSEFVVCDNGREKRVSNPVRTVCSVSRQAAGGSATNLGYLS